LRAARSIALAALVVASVAWAAEPPARVVMVSIDGLMPAYYLKAGELGLKVPNLSRLMKEGAYARGVIGVVPSVTYPSHTTLITGVPPRLHGIAANTVFDPDGRSGGAWEWFASAIRVPTLVSAARARSLTTATVSWPVSLGMESDWNLPEFWRPGSEHAIDLRLLGLLCTPGLMDEVVKHRGRPYPYPLTDSARVDGAVYLLEARRPQLALLHIFEVDSAQHRHGPMTPEAKAAVENSDAELGRVLAALRSSGAEKETLVAVVSDHGFLPTSRVLRPNVLLREAGLIQVDEKGKVTAWQACFHASGGSAALRLKDPDDAAVLERVRSLVDARRQVGETGIRDVLDARQIAEAGGAEDALLLLNAREGAYFSGAVDGSWSGPTTSKGGHGFLPDRDEMHAGLILSGPGFQDRGDLGVVRMTAIAPTLARHLGVSLDPRADEPIPLR